MLLLVQLLHENVRNVQMIVKLCHDYPFSLMAVRQGKRKSHPFIAIVVSGHALIPSVCTKGGALKGYGMAKTITKVTSRPSLKEHHTDLITSRAAIPQQVQVQLS